MTLAASGVAPSALASAQQQLLVALDNMPGALVYTDGNLDIVFCNQRFREMYLVPQELLEPGVLTLTSSATSPSTGTTARAIPPRR